MNLLPACRWALWVVPSPLARDRLIRALATRWSPGDPEPRVRCWDDLWRWVAAASTSAPSLLSTAAATGVFDQALRDAASAGRLGPLADLVAMPGHRSRLKRRIRDWTIAERHRRPDDGGDGDGDGDMDHEPGWPVFLRYRQLLAELNAEDDAGLAVWASIRLRDRAARARASSDAGDHLIFLDFDGRAPARWRVLKDALDRPRTVDVTFAHCDDPALGETHPATLATRDRLLGLGLVETSLPSSPNRPAGLRAVEDRLFREGAADPNAPRIDAGAGLSIRGGPEGEDLGRLVVREVGALLDQGAEPDDLLIVFPQWDDQAAVVCQTMRRAGLPVHDASPRPLDLDPAVAALLQAAQIPLEDWETELVVRLLRNGQVRPDWEEVAGPFPALAETGAAVRDAPAFRGSRQILRAFERSLAEVKTPTEENRLNRVHRVMSRLIETLEPLNQPRPWPSQAAALKTAAEALGLGARDGRALEALWDGLDDQTAALEQLGRTGEGEAIDWAAFVASVVALAAETPQPRAQPPAGSIRTALADELAGARAAFVLLVGLDEGSFPRRSAARLFLTTRPGEAPSEAARQAHAEEMLRFLRVVGAADRGVSMFYPTTDAKGQPLLRAGFLDELLGALTPAVAAAIHESHGRFHPALLDGGEALAVSPADRLVLAAALAADRGELDKLTATADDPTRADALRGAAAALRALDGRRRGQPLGEYEGRITGDAAIAAIAAEFGPDCVFSASQLETFLNCPFQFFARHVLRLKPPEERDELDEDLTERGSRLHDILQALEELALEAADGRVDEELADRAIAEIRAREPEAAGELELALRDIEYEQVRRIIILQYLRQRAEYMGDSPAPPIPERFEYGFGEKGTADPEFAIEIDSEVVRLRGWIDRVDRIETEAGPRRRVIDYKSGNPPSGADVIEGRMLQLPLYAMAAEHLLRDEGEGKGEDETSPPDMGYWGLKEKGFKTIKFKEEWEETKRATRERVLDVIHRLRSGEFVVTPRKHHCETYCEYRGVCRIRQVRAAGKAGGDEEE